MMFCRWVSEGLKTHSWNPNRTTTGVRLAGTSSRSECIRALETPGVYLPVSHTAREDDETDSAMRRCVPRPSAVGPARYHVPYCAWRAGAVCGGRAMHGECTLRRKPGHPAYSQGDTAAAHAVLGAAECHRARVKLGLSRDSWLPSV
jgi:hypothetical protein